MADRVGMTIGRKISDNNYGSYEASVWMETEVRSGESVEDALTRCEETLEPVLSQRLVAQKTR